MSFPRTPSVLLLAALVLLGGCATRPVNPPLARADPEAGYRLATRQPYFNDQENRVVLAFSGGGTRAAAGRIIMASPDIQRLLKVAGATIVADPGGSGATAIPAAR
jgi:hypothetical protein